MKLLPALVIPAALCALALGDLAAAQARPIAAAAAGSGSRRSSRRPRRLPEASEPEEPPPPSACRLRLTAELAVAPSLPPLVGRGECGVDDVVRLEAVVLRDKTRVAVTPPAIVRCTFAEAIVQWVREDVAPAVRPLGAPLRSLDNYAAYDCRGRNRIVGAKLSRARQGQCARHPLGEACQWHPAWG